jgi:pteridine reductase
MEGTFEKVVLVTGGAVRLGRAICVALADAGCHVLVHHHSSHDAAQSLEAEIRARGGSVDTLRADLTKPESIEHLFVRIDTMFGGLDGLVNNAAAFERVAFEAVTFDSLERMWRLNAMAPFLCAQHAVALMRNHGGGSIVNITDIAAERPFVAHSHYCMSKAALLSLTRSLAIELAPEIRVNAVAPGSIIFPDSYDELKREMVLRRVPMGRTGTLQELAEAVRFLLLGPEFITGQVLAVDGGRSARL